MKPHIHLIAFALDDISFRTVALVRLACAVVLAALLASCGLLNPPSQTIGYQINNATESKPTIQVASNGAQAAGLYGGTVTPGDGGSGPLIGNSVGGDASRSTDADLAASLQTGNKQTTQAQSRDQSPQTTSAEARDGRQAQVATAVGEVANASSEGVKPEEGQGAREKQE